MKAELDLLEKHYKIMLETLDDIKDEINSSIWQDHTTQDYRLRLQKIEDMAALASPIDLFNPYNLPNQARAIIEGLTAKTIPAPHNKTRLPDDNR